MAQAAKESARFDKLNTRITKALRSAAARPALAEYAREREKDLRDKLRSATNKEGAPDKEKVYELGIRMSELWMIDLILGWNEKIGTRAREELSKNV